MAFDFFLFAALVASGLAVVVMLISEVRRRRNADRWANTLGLARMPHESTSDLIKRCADKARVRFGGR
jgi:hypothetical protein